jgi:uncharacterized protein YodC (DUF2158 family)
MTTFNVGDVVKLRSGGPDMTVENAGADEMNRPTVWCAWFDNTGNYRHEAFALQAVILSADRPRAETTAKAR